MTKIHPTAVVDPSAEIAESVEIGPYCVVEKDVTIGEGTILRPYVVVRQYTTIGKGNFIDSFSSLGGIPQDYGFDDKSVTYVKVGDNNVFREYVTINRATGDGNSTIVGNNTMWMVHAHAGHNVRVDDNAILTNGVNLGGYSHLGKRAILSANVSVHQFTWVGEGVMAQGNSGTSTHIPPFCMTAYGINRLIGLNKVGLRRNPELTDEDRKQVAEAFRIVYRSGLKRKEFIEALDARTDFGPAASRFRDFIHRVDNAEGPYKRPLCKYTKL